jgi:hypothetical protein
MTQRIRRRRLGQTHRDKPFPCIATRGSRAVR